jgi:hypothetical protein
VNCPVNPASALTGFTGQFTVTWPDGQRVSQPARLDTVPGTPTSGDFTAAVLVPPGTGTATVTFTGAAPGVQGQARTSFPVRPGGGLVVTLDNTSGRRVAPGGTLPISGTITNGQPGTSIVFALTGLSSDVVASLVSPSGPVPVLSGRQPITLTIRVGAKARLGQATGRIQWAPADQDSDPADWLSPASLDLIISYPPPPLSSHWWFWTAIGIAAAAGVALLAWGLYIRWAKYRYLRHPVTVGPGDIWDPAGGPGNDHWDK